MTFGSITFKKTTRLANRKFAPLWLLVSGAALEACGSSGGTTNLTPSIIVADDASLRTFSFTEDAVIDSDAPIFDVDATGPEGTTFKIEQTDDTSDENTIELFEINSATGVITFVPDTTLDYENPGGIGVDFPGLSSSGRDDANTYIIKVVAEANGLDSKAVTYTVTITDQAEAAVLADPINPNVDPDHNIVAPPPASSGVTTTLDIPVAEFLAAFVDDDTNPANQITHLSFNITELLPNGDTLQLLPDGVTLQHKIVVEGGANIIVDITDEANRVDIRAGGNIVATIADGASVGEVKLSYSGVEDEGGEGEAVTDVASLTFYVNHAPTISSVDTDVDGATVDSNNAIEIDENTDADVAIFRIRLNDIDGHVLEYSLEGDDANLFDVERDIDDANIAIISFRSSPDFETPQDDGGDNIYDITIVATDTLTSEVIRDLTVTVNDQNEAVTNIELKDENGDATTSIDENKATTNLDTNGDGTLDSYYCLIGTVSYTDPDDPDSVLNFTNNIVSVNDTSNFYLDTATNKLYLTTLLDYETLPNSYDIIITVRDADGDDALVSTEMITIRVVDINEKPTDIALSSNSVAENEPPFDIDGTNYYFVGDIIVTDPDTSLDDAFLNTLAVKGTDSDYFEIVGFKLYLKSQPDFETKETYDISIVANENDPLLVFTAPIVINVLNPDNAVVTVTNTATDAVVTNFDTNPLLIAENVDLTTTEASLYTFSGTDLDADETVKFRLAVEDSIFQIDADSGVLTFASSPNFEATGAPTYDVEVIAYSVVGVGTVDEAVVDSSDVSTIVKIKITDVNEKATNIELLDESGVAITSIIENQLSAVPFDADEDPATDNVNYYFVGDITVTETDALGAFNNPLIVTGTDSDDFEIFDGKLYLKSQPDFETKDSYSIQIVENGGVTDLEFISAQIDITVENADDRAEVTVRYSVGGPEVEDLSIPLSIDENVPTATVLYIFTGTDQDADDQGVHETVKFELSTTDATDGIFQIVANADGTASLTFVSSPNFEVENPPENNIYDVEVIAYSVVGVGLDEAVVDLSEVSTIVKIKITDVAELADVEVRDSVGVADLNTAISIAENSDATLYTFIGIDQDADETVKFKLGATDSIFQIDADSGVLTFASSPNFEATGAPSYDVEVIAYSVTLVDNGPDIIIDSSEFSITVKIEVTDVDDVPTGIVIQDENGVATTSIIDNPVSVPVDTNDDGTFDANYYLVGTVAVTDEDTSEAFSTNPLAITGTDLSKFEIVAGKLYLKFQPDFTAQQSYSIQIVANQGDPLEFTSQIDISVVDPDLAVVTVTNTATDAVVTDFKTVILIAENVDETTTEASLYTFSGVDRGVDETVKFELGDATDSIFLINADTGVLTFVSSPNFEATGAPTYDVVVIAYSVDTSGRIVDSEVSTTVKIQITDVNERPTDIKLLDDESGVAITSILENQLSVVAFDTDEDPTTDDVNYFLVGDITVADVDDTNTFSNTLIVTGTDSDDFEIFDGKLYLKSQADYEAKDSYSISIVANKDDTTGLELASDPIVITVVNADDTATVTVTKITEDQLVTDFGTALEIAENTVGTASVLYQFKGEDQDDGETVKFELADGTIFDLTDSGILSFKNSPNFEDPQDADTDNIYSVEVIAYSVDSNGAKVVDQIEVSTIVKIEVTDVNEAPFNIEILDEFNVVTTSIDENPLSVAVDTSGDGTNDANYYLIGTVSYTDPDTDPDPDVASFTNNIVSIDTASETNFYFDSVTKELYLRSKPDFETAPTSGYSVTIIVQDADPTLNLTTLKMITITVDDINEAPVITGPFDIGEVIKGSADGNGKSVLISQLLADNRYSDEDADDTITKLEITGISAVGSDGVPITPDDLTLTYTAQGSGAVNLIIGSQIDTQDASILGNIDISIADTVVADVIFEITYKIYDIGGLVSNEGTLKFLAVTSPTVQFVGTDGTTVVTGDTVLVDENSDINTIVATVTATATDSTLSIVYSLEDALFAIDSMGEITLKSGDLDFETLSQHTLTIFATASDSDTATDDRFTAFTLVVNVRDVNDAATNIEIQDEFNVVTTSITENEPPVVISGVDYYLIGTVSYTDPDDTDTGDANFITNTVSIAPASEANFYLGADDKLYLIAKPDFETAPTSGYSVTIIVEDALNNTLATSETIIITVDDANDAPELDDPSVTSFDIDTPIPGTISISQLTAKFTDPDQGSPETDLISGTISRINFEPLTNIILEYGGKSIDSSTLEADRYFVIGDGLPEINIQNFDQTTATFSYTVEDRVGGESAKATLVFTNIGDSDPDISLEDNILPIGDGQGGFYYSISISEHYADGSSPVFTSVYRHGDLYNDPDDTTDIPSLAKVLATDADDDDALITYSISQVDTLTPDVEVDFFEISATGVLTIKDSTLFSYDLASTDALEYKITIIATSDTQNSDPIVLFVGINALPEFVVVGLESIGATVDFDNPDTILFELTASNFADNIYSTYEYSIVSQKDGLGADLVVDLFEVEATTGEVTLIAGKSLDGVNTYTITVVSSGWTSADTTLPGIVGDTLGLTLTVREDLEINADVTNLHYEKELGDAKVGHTYSLVGTGSDLFSVATKNGKTLLSYNLDNIEALTSSPVASYLFTLEERVAGVDGVDGDLVETLLFTATIVEVDASADVSVDAASASYNELLGEISITEGTSAVGDITILIPGTTPPEGIVENVGLVVYDLIGENDRDLFAIDSATGVITFNEIPDYENPFKTDGKIFADALVGLNTYSITVRATTSDDSPFYSSIVVRDLVVKVTDDPTDEIFLLQDRESSFGVTVGYEAVTGTGADIIVSGIAGTHDDAGGTTLSYRFIPAGTIILPILGSGVFSFTVFDITADPNTLVTVLDPDNPFAIINGNLVIKDINSALDDGDTTVVGVEGGVQVDDIRQVYQVTITDDATVPNIYDFSIKLSPFNIDAIFADVITTDVSIFENPLPGYSIHEFGVELHNLPVPTGYSYTLGTTLTPGLLSIGDGINADGTAGGLQDDLLIQTPTALNDYEPLVGDFDIIFTLSKDVGSTVTEVVKKSLSVEIKAAPVVGPQDFTVVLDLGESSTTDLDLKTVFLPALEVADGYAAYDIVTYAIADENPQNLKDIFTTTAGTDLVVDQLSIDPSFDYETTFIPVGHDVDLTGYSDGYLKHINTVDIILDVTGTIDGSSGDEKAKANLKISLVDDTEEIVFVSSSSATIYTDTGGNVFYVAKAVKESELSTPVAVYEYTISDANSKFTINDDATGQVTAVGALDGDKFTVIATDTTNALLKQEFEVTVSVTVPVVGGDDGSQPDGLDPLYFIHKGYTDIYAVENEAADSLLYKVYDNTLINPDPYTLAGVDAQLFSISTTGELRFLSSQDFEIPADSNADRTYEVTINATVDLNPDGSNLYSEAPINLIIHIVDVDEAPILVEGDTDFVFVIGTDDYLSQLRVFNANDDDGDVINYSVTGDDGLASQIFDISVTGELTFKNQPSVAEDLTGQVKASSTDSSGVELSDTIDFTVKVIDASLLFGGSDSGSSFEASDGDGDVVDLIPVDHWIG